MTWMAIAFLKMLGLAKNIKVAQLDPKTEPEPSNEVEADPFFTATIVRKAA